MTAILSFSRFIAGILLFNPIIMAAGTEHQKYNVVKKYDHFEIRFYPPATLATYYSPARSYRDIAGSGFRVLAGYIFGGNESDTKISMTAPVHMDLNNDRSSMSFVMPSGYNPSNLPKPNDKRVVIEETEGEYYAVVSFPGYASDKAIQKHTERLRKLLKDNNIEYYGNFRYLGYNPPYQFINRRNEVMVAVKWGS